MDSADGGVPARLRVVDGSAEQVAAAAAAESGSVPRTSAS